MCYRLRVAAVRIDLSAVVSLDQMMALRSPASLPG